MAKKLSKKHEKALKLVEKYKEEQDWEKGDRATFEALLAKAAAELPDSLTPMFWHYLADEIEKIHAQERGSFIEFFDIARQEWLSEILVATIKSTLKSKQSAPIAISKSASREITARIDSLLAALEENIEAYRLHRNTPPALDLHLNENAGLLQLTNELITVLGDLRNTLHALSSKSPDTPLAKQALKEFVLQLSGTLGKGIGGTITWGTRIALGWLAIGILKDLGVPTEQMAISLSSLLPKN